MKIFYATIFILISIQAVATAPTSPASNFHFNSIDGGFFNIGWSSGNGARRVIICKAGGPVTYLPQNGMDYIENTNFGSGQQVAPGEYVIYDNAFTSFFLTGLTPATQYFFAVFEYNGTGSATEYLTSSFLTSNGTTSSTPTIQTSDASFTGITTNSVTFTWVNGNGARRLVVVREGSPVNQDPVNSQQYNVNSVFGNGAQIGSGNYTVYNSSGVSTTITNLRPGTQYHFAFYEFNGVNQPQYKMPAYTTSVTTRSIPTIASTNVAITKIDGKELGLGWANGNGQRRIIVAKQGSNITGTPVNGIDYAANSVFGTGPTIAAGEYVVYDDNFNAATISGLNPGTSYFFKIFEYDGTGTNTVYLISTFGSVNGSTATTPTQQAASITSNSITSTSLNLSWAMGNGRARLVVGRKNAPVNFTPQDFSVYNANSDFGNGQDLGSGNFAIAATTNNFVNVHNLEPNTTYHFAIFEYNGFNQPLFLAPAVVFNATTSLALPVKLIKWEAVPVNGKVKLQWATGSELNASHFIIERSPDGTNFLPLITVQATGNSQSETNYSKEDITPLDGKSYYRLRIVDIDGKFELSPVRSVLRSAQQSVQLTRNPVQGAVEFITSSAVGGNQSEWQIIGVRGDIIKKGVIIPGRMEINISALPAGNYWLRVVINNQSQSLAFLKQ
ncbi:MAG TPA: hypothetical protein VFI06_06075 [Chitinophagaceae bacterium]|nr:hypothetical protein [Chitinophagaceae bacterium]